MMKSYYYSFNNIKSVSNNKNNNNNNNNKSIQIHNHTKALSVPKNFCFSSSSSRPDIKATATTTSTGITTLLDKRGVYKNLGYSNLYVSRNRKRTIPKINCMAMEKHAKKVCKSVENSNKSNNNDNSIINDTGQNTSSNMVLINRADNATTAENLITFIKKWITHISDPQECNSLSNKKQYT